MNIEVKKAKSAFGFGIVWYYDFKTLDIAIGSFGIEIDLSDLLDKDNDNEGHAEPGKVE